MTGIVEIFTDGACEPNPGPGGWAFVVYEDGKELLHDSGFEPQTTNNRMEMTGLLRGIEAASAISAPVTLWSDSQYCVRGVNEWRHGWKRKGWKKSQNAADHIKNVDLWIAIDEALERGKGVGPPLAIRWCKGHSGILGNERADELSYAAARNQVSSFLHDEPNDYLTAQYRRVMAE